MRQTTMILISFSYLMSFQLATIMISSELRILLAYFSNFVLYFNQDLKSPK